MNYKQYLKSTLRSAFFWLKLFYIGDVALNNSMKPYTYIIKHKPTDRFYYGYRGANKVEAHEDLWNKYYTSSPTIKKLIEQDGVDSFEVEVRKIFETAEQAAQWETKVLKRMRVLETGKWINANISGYRNPTEVGRKRISETHKGKPKTQEH